MKPGVYQTSGHADFHADLYFRYFDGQAWREPTKEADKAQEMPTATRAPRSWREQPEREAVPA